MNQLLHTPEGVRDIFGQECDKKRYIERRIEKMFRSYGYQSIETPSFEFFDVFGKEVGTTPSRELYKFFDREGNTLVLRPDFTPSVARSASMYFQEENMPLRLCYHGNVFINNSRYQGRLKESTQMGVELINDDTAAADAEVIALAANALLRAGVEDFQVSIGEVGFFGSLVEEAGLQEEQIEELKGLLAIKNIFGAQEMIRHCNLPKKTSQALYKLPELFGNQDILDTAETITDNPRARQSIERLKNILMILKSYGVEKYISFDLSMVSDYRYYTGIILQAYTYGTGDAVIKGGRYDSLLEQFGKKASAVGFTAEVDSLLNAIDRQKIMLPIRDIKTMVLSPADCWSFAISQCRKLREKGVDTALVRCEESVSVDDYIAYGRRNQFGKVLVIRGEGQTEEISL